MSANLSIKETATVSLLAGVYSAIISILMLQLPLSTESIGIFPIADNIIQIVSIAFGVSLGALTLERYYQKDLYNDKEIIIGSFLISLISIFTVGLGVPPFNITPYWAAVTATVVAQSFIFTWFVLPYARTYDFI